ncbi:MAG: polysaccharide deacetylase family protein [Bacteroidota bacterium]|nr:polysaccharide deacetylase family protein [Bacteroidota bacterium]
MVNILIDKINSRFEYISKILFEYILKADYQIIEKKDFDLKKNNLTIHINYSNEIETLSVNIPNASFLNKNKLFEIDFETVDDVFPRLFFLKNENYDIDFDLFSASFYLITEYEKYLKAELDEHDRYNESAIKVYQNKWYRKPLINIYAEFLWTKLKEKFPELKREKTKFSYDFTFDVDQPWAYLNKGFYTYIGFIKDILKFDFKNFKNRFKAVASGVDPFDVYDFIFKKCPAEKTTFFFLISGNSKYDERFTLKNKYLRKLINEISEKGCKIGIHPSYNSYKDKELLEFEKKELEKILNKKVFYSRQHFLRYQLPQTFEYLDDIGIEHEFTSSMISNVGFKNFIAVTFPWFNLVENRITNLMIHPTMVMDATLKNYLDYSPQEAVESVERIIEECKKVNGNFVLLWHNSSLGESFGWEGWKDVFNKIIDKLK